MMSLVIPTSTFSQTIGTYSYLITFVLPQVSPHYISLCWFRIFIMNFVQITSAWFLACIAFDRLIRACLSHCTTQWCTNKNVIIARFITILCSVTFNSDIFQPIFSTIFPFTRVIYGLSRVNVTDYTILYYTIWC